MRRLNKAGIWIKSIYKIVLMYFFKGLTFVYKFGDQNISFKWMYKYYVTDTFYKCFVILFLVWMYPKSSYFPELHYCSLIFLFKIFHLSSGFLKAQKFTQDGYFVSIFFNLELTIMALLSYFAIKGAWLRLNLFISKEKCLSKLF